MGINILNADKQWLGYEHEPGVLRAPSRHQLGVTAAALPASTVEAGHGDSGTSVGHPTSQHQQVRPHRSHLLDPNLDQATEQALKHDYWKRR